MWMNYFSPLVYSIYLVHIYLGLYSLVKVSVRDGMVRDRVIHRRPGQDGSVPCIRDEDLLIHSTKFFFFFQVVHFAPAFRPDPVCPQQINRPEVYGRIIHGRCAVVRTGESADGQINERDAVSLPGNDDMQIRRSASALYSQNLFLLIFSITKKIVRSVIVDFQFFLFLF